MKYYEYRRCCELNKDPNPHGLAFVAAYKDYLLRLGIRDVTKQQLDDSETFITGERMNLLIGKGYERNWKTIPEGGITCFGVDDGKLMYCRKCDVIHFVEAHFRTYICDSCK